MPYRKPISSMVLTVSLADRVAWRPWSFVVAFLATIPTGLDWW
jgi:hypothetical protein